MGRGRSISPAHCRARPAPLGCAAFAPTTDMTLTYQHIEAAADRLKGHIERTPQRRSRTLSEITGAQVWIKFENLQFTASFKERGALNKLLTLSDEERKRGVIAASAGNHAQALAYHGQRLGVPVTIVVPKATPMVKVEHTRRFGAEVVIEGESYDEAGEHAAAIRRQLDLVLVHPFDDLEVMAGQGTVAKEMLEEEPGLEELIVPVGGGGLIAGAATAAKALSPDIRVIGAEAAMYPSFAARMRGLPAAVGGQTIAEGIAVKQVGELTYAVARPLLEDVVLVEEAYLERAVALYSNVEKTIAEGAGAAGLGALLAHPSRFRGKKIGLILSGGNIDSRLLASVLTRELVREQRLVSLRIIGDDRPGLLATVSAVIGQAGGNIIEVAHNRLALDVPAKGAEFDIMVETRDAQHTREIMDALRDKGYPPRAV
jgi:threonine dehydratase